MVICEVNNDVNVAVSENSKCVVWMVWWWLVGDVFFVFLWGGVVRFGIWVYDVDRYGLGYTCSGFRVFPVCRRVDGRVLVVGFCCFEMVELMLVGL